VIHFAPLPPPRRSLAWKAFLTPFPAETPQQLELCLEIQAQASREGFLGRLQRLRLRVVVFSEAQRVNLKPEDSLGQQPQLHNRRREDYLALQRLQLSRRLEVFLVRQQLPRSHKRAGCLETRLPPHNQLQADYLALRLQNHKLVDFLDLRRRHLNRSPVDYSEQQQQVLNLRAGDISEQPQHHLNPKPVGFSVASTTQIRTSHLLLYCRQSSSYFDLSNLTHSVVI
jgi:hypothetical protein